MKKHITHGSVLDDLGFEKNVASSLKMRATLMRAIKEKLDQLDLTQAKAAHLLHVSQPRISDLKNGKIHLFTIDRLVEMLTQLGNSVHLIIDDRLVA